MMSLRAYSRYAQLYYRIFYHEIWSIFVKEFGTGDDDIADAADGEAEEEGGGGADGGADAGGGGGDAAARAAHFAALGCWKTGCDAKCQKCIVDVVAAKCKTSAIGTFQ